MSDFCPKKARASRPMPFPIVDLVMEMDILAPDEFYAYIRLLSIMWRSPDVALPFDPRKLSRSSGISLRLWTSRVWPAISQFMSVEGDTLTHTRLRNDAIKEEKNLASKSRNRLLKNSTKSLKTNKRGRTVDISTDITTDATDDHTNNVSVDPSSVEIVEGPFGDLTTTSEPEDQVENSSRPEATVPDHLPAPVERHLPSNVSELRKDTWGRHKEAVSRVSTSRPGATTEWEDDDLPMHQKIPPEFREKLMEAMGLDPSGITPCGKALLTDTNMFEIEQWLKLPHINLDNILREVARVASSKPGGPARSFKYFTPSIRMLSGQLSAPPLEPIYPDQSHNMRSNHATSRATKNAARFEAFISGAVGRKTYMDCRPCADPSVALLAR